MKRIWVDREKCVGCKTCELRCAIERDSVGKTLYSAVQEEPKPVPRVGVFGRTGAAFPLQCRHCEDAPCLAACPSGAMQRDPETGLIFVQADRCRGCWMCVMACPMGVIIPSAYKTAMKCDACRHMEAPVCVSSCPTGALLFETESGYQKVLAEKRGRLALFARGGEGGASGVVGIEFVREGH
jgi:carbon-monoxide dehydrogenase iron sulfur subunit